MELAPICNSRCIKVPFALLGWPCDAHCWTVWGHRGGPTSQRSFMPPGVSSMLVRPLLYPCWELCSSAAGRGGPVAKLRRWPASDAGGRG